MLSFVVRECRLKQFDECVDLGGSEVPRNMWIHNDLTYGCAVVLDFFPPLEIVRFVCSFIRSPCITVERMMFADALIRDP